MSAVFTSWSHLADRPFRALAYMALVSMDTDCPPRYFGGYPAIARALGRDTSDVYSKNAATAAERRKRKADMEAVRIALAPLLAAGVIVQDVAEAPGRRPEFALLLDERSRRTLLDGPGMACQRSRDGLPTVQASPADLGGVGGETLQTEEETGEVGTLEGTTSPNVSSSLAIPAEEIEARYSAAREILAKLPDLGAAFMARTDPGQPLKARVIAAAEIARPQEAS